MAVRQSARTLCHLVRGPPAPHKVRVHKVGVHKVGGTRFGKNVWGWVVCVRKFDVNFEESDTPAAHSLWRMCIKISLVWLAHWRNLCFQWQTHESKIGATLSGGHRHPRRVTPPLSLRKIVVFVVFIVFERVLLCLNGFLNCIVVYSLLLQFVCCCMFCRVFYLFF